MDTIPVFIGLPWENDPIEDAMKLEYRKNVLASDKTSSDMSGVNATYICSDFVYDSMKKPYKKDDY